MTIPQKIFVKYLQNHEYRQLVDLLAELAHINYESTRARPMLEK